MNDLGLKDFFVSSRKEKTKLRHFLREQRIYSVMRQNKNAFMKLFSLFYFDLWD